MIASEYDYIVVGGGSAGVALAARLAEFSPYRIALIEAGPSAEHDPQVRVYRQWLTLLGTDYDYDYEIEAQERGNERIRHARGRMLGGSSAHNSVIAFCAPDDDLRLWEARGATGWGPVGTHPYFERMLQRVQLETPPLVNPIAEAYLEAAQQAGFQLRDAADDNITEGVVRFQLNIRGDLRQSSADAYLFGPAFRPDNLDVLTDTMVQRIVVDQHGDATAVETTRGTLRATREIILAAGAFGSPQLLLLSGIGPARHLQRVGVPVRRDLPAVGQHLQDHIEAVVIWEAAQPIPNVGAQRWEQGLFARTIPTLPTYDMMMHFGSEKYYVDFAELGFVIPEAEHVFCMAPNVARPHSEGVVQLRSSDPAAPPLIDPAYFTDADNHDERVLIEGIRIARHIASQPALQPWVKRELAPGPGFTSDEDIGHYARRTSNTVYHPCGTCRMGAADDDDAVVDPQLRVRGVGRLRVADASVFPTMIGPNPNLTCMMVGEKAADLILERTIDR